MKLYLISQNVNNGYDTYDSAVVAAENENEAKRVYPGDSSGYQYDEYERTWFYVALDGTRHRYCYDWAQSADDVTVQYIGEAAENTPAGAICSSFNAG